MSSRESAVWSKSRTSLTPFSPPPAFPTNFLSSPTFLTATSMSTKCPFSAPELVTMSLMLRKVEEALLGMLRRLRRSVASPRCGQSMVRPPWKTSCAGLVTWGLKAASLPPRSLACTLGRTSSTTIPTLNSAASRPASSSLLHTVRLTMSVLESLRVKPVTQRSETSLRVTTFLGSDL